MLNMVIGFTLAVLSAVCYGASAVLTKMVSDQGVAVPTILLFRGVIGGMMLAGLCKINGRGGMRLEKGMGRKAVVLSVLGSGATLLLLNQAYLYLPVGSVTTIHYLFPAVVNLIGAYLSKKRLKTATKLVLLICMGGTLLLFDSLTRSQLPGIIYAAVSILTWSFQILYLEYSGLVTCPAPAVAARQCAVVAAMGIIYGMIKGHTFEVAVHALPLLLLTTLFNNVLANILFQEGIKRIGGSLSAILCIFEPVSSILLGYILLGEVLSRRQMIAILLILTAIGILIIKNSKRERDTA